MKKFLTAVIIAFGVIACTTYDDTELRGEIDNLKAQVDALDVQLQKTNANLNALQTIVNALDGNEYITAIEDVKDADGKVIGYTITFAQAGRKTIYNGQDGHSPAIQAVMHPELGVYCWQLDGEWLLADGGQGGPVGCGYQAVRVFLSLLFSAPGHAGQQSRIAVFLVPFHSVAGKRVSARSLENGA